MNDTKTIENVLRNHNVDDVPRDVFKAMYQDAVHDKPNFFMVDIKGGSLRKNFVHYYTKRS